MAVVFMCSKHEKIRISIIFITMLARCCCNEDSGSGFEGNTTGSSHDFETTTYQLGNTTGELFTSTAQLHNVTMTTLQQTTETTTYHLGNTSGELFTSTAQPHNITMTTSQQTTENTTFRLGSTTGKIYTSTVEPHNITMTTPQQTTRTTEFHEITMTTSQQTTDAVTLHEITISTEQITTTLSCELLCNGGNQECIYDKCVCSDGYESVNKYCTKVCPDACPKHSSCKNAEIGCQCDSGFTNYDDDSGCSDIDECKTNCNDIISQNCTNYPGSFSCSCKEGYYLYEHSCLPQPEECPNDCGEHSECKDPSKGCECAPGWTYGEIDEESCPS
uniref:latent-transforming growth factor beta-binding protein 3-like n=1 Tax=Styela clava TaxID=7725 RepID=UPI00193A0586|nr:latent-transforming growth factor beta-binding protein 3-like [Styela clava]